MYLPETCAPEGDVICLQHLLRADHGLPWSQQLLLKYLEAVPEIAPSVIPRLETSTLKLYLVRVLLDQLGVQRPFRSIQQMSLYLEARVHNLCHYARK